MSAKECAAGVPCLQNRHRVPRRGIEQVECCWSCSASGGLAHSSHCKSLLMVQQVKQAIGDRFSQQLMDEGLDAALRVLPSNVESWIRRTLTAADKVEGMDAVSSISNSAENAKEGLGVEEEWSQFLLEGEGDAVSQPGTFGVAAGQPLKGKYESSHREGDKKMKFSEESELKDQVIDAGAIGGDLGAKTSELRTSAPVFQPIDSRASLAAVTGTAQAVAGSEESIDWEKAWVERCKALVSLGVSAAQGQGLQKLSEAEGSFKPAAQPSQVVSEVAASAHDHGGGDGPDASVRTKFEYSDLVGDRYFECYEETRREEYDREKVSEQEQLLKGYEAARALQLSYGDKSQLAAEQARHRQARHKAAIEQLELMKDLSETEMESQHTLMASFEKEKSSRWRSSFEEGGISQVLDAREGSAAGRQGQGVLMTSEHEQQLFGLEDEISEEINTMDVENIDEVEASAACIRSYLSEPGSGPLLSSQQVYSLFALAGAAFVITVMLDSGANFMPVMEYYLYMQLMKLHPDDFAYPMWYREKKTARGSSDKGRISLVGYGVVNLRRDNHYFRVPVTLMMGGNTGAAHLILGNRFMYDFGVRIFYDLGYWNIMRPWGKDLFCDSSKRPAQVMGIKMYKRLPLGAEGRTEHAKVQVPWGLYLRELRSTDFSREASLQIFDSAARIQDAKHAPPPNVAVDIVTKEKQKGSYKELKKAGSNREKKAEPKTREEKVSARELPEKGESKSDKKRGNAVQVPAAKADVEIPKEDSKPPKAEKASPQQQTQYHIPLPKVVYAIVVGAITMFVLTAFQLAPGATAFAEVFVKQGDAAMVNRRLIPTGKGYQPGILPREEVLITTDWSGTALVPIVNTTELGTVFNVGTPVATLYEPTDVNRLMRGLLKEKNPNMLSREAAVAEEMLKLHEGMQASSMGEGVDGEKSSKDILKASTSKELLRKTLDAYYQAATCDVECELGGEDPIEYLLAEGPGCIPKEDTTEQQEFFTLQWSESPPVDCLREGPSYENYTVDGNEKSLSRQKKLYRDTKEYLSRAGRHQGQICPEGRLETENSSKVDRLDEGQNYSGRLSRGPVSDDSTNAKYFKAMNKRSHATGSSGTARAHS